MGSKNSLGREPCMLACVSTCFSSGGLRRAPSVSLQEVRSSVVTVSPVLTAARCVRVGCMGQKELFQIDSHPLVHKCERTLKLVAHSYLAVCYGSSHPAELACIVSSSQRPRLAVKPEALNLLRRAGALAVPIAGA